MDRFREHPIWTAVGCLAFLILIAAFCGGALLFGPNIVQSAGNLLNGSDVVDNPANEGGDVDVVECPEFGGVQTRPISDGGCKMETQPRVLTDEVPDGFFARYWTLDETTRYARNGEIRTAEATFYPDSTWEDRAPLGEESNSDAESDDGSLVNLDPLMERLDELEARYGQNGESQNGNGDGPSTLGGNAPGSEMSDEGCVTTAEAKEILGLDVQRIDTEYCAFVWRSFGVADTDVTLNAPFVGTLHLSEGGEPFDGDIAVFEPDGETYQIWAGTFRIQAAYPQTDMIHDLCQLVEKEDAFGQREVPSFRVFAGNFVCNGGTAPTGQTGAVTTPMPLTGGGGDGVSASELECPTFGGVVTQPGDDGSPYCSYNGAVVTASVPAGFTAHYWTGTAEATAGPGESIQTATATFRPVSD